MVAETIVFTHNKVLTDLLLRSYCVFFLGLHPLILIEEHVLKPAGHLSLETCFPTVHELDFESALIEQSS
jgi:hypothetical protein